MPTTDGSPPLQRAVATQDSSFVERMKAAGAIVIGNTNVPELGLGSHTCNALFGPAPNAWDAEVTGLQLIGRPRGDAALLEAATGCETIVPELLARRPPEPAA